MVCDQTKQKFTFLVQMQSVTSGASPTLYITKSTPSLLSSMVVTTSCHGAAFHQQGRGGLSGSKGQWMVQSTEESLMKTCYGPGFTTRGSTWDPHKCPVLKANVPRKTPWPGRLLSNHEHQLTSPSLTGYPSKLCLPEEVTTLTKFCALSTHSDYCWVIQWVYTG